MSTIDLGKIKLVWRGAYNNATAYTPDDVVSSGGQAIFASSHQLAMLSLTRLIGMY